MEFDESESRIMLLEGLATVKNPVTNGLSSNQMAVSGLSCSQIHRQADTTQKPLVNHLYSYSLKIP